MKGKKIKDILSAVIICAVLLTFLSGCSDKKVDVTVSSTVSGKVTKSGVIEYNGQYFIWDRNGVNYKSDIDTKSIVVAHTSKKNGRVLSNFAVTDDYVFFIGDFKGDSNKIIIPTDMAGLVGLANGLTEGVTPRTAPIVNQ
jgi:hypothetical protein